MHVARRKELYEAEHPETKHGKAPGKAGGGKKAKDRNLRSFVKETASKTGQYHATVSRDARRAAQGAVRGAAPGDEKGRSGC
jgi:hypothetical protein